MSLLKYIIEFISQALNLGIRALSGGASKRVDLRPQLIPEAHCLRLLNLREVALALQVTRTYELLLIGGGAVVVRAEYPYVAFKIPLWLAVMRDGLTFSVPLPFRSERPWT